MNIEDTFLAVTKTVDIVIDGFDERVNKRVDFFLQAFLEEVSSFQRFSKEIKICEYQSDVHEFREAANVIVNWMTSQNIKYTHSYLQNSMVVLYVDVKSLMSWKETKQNNKLTVTEIGYANGYCS